MVYHFMGLPLEGEKCLLWLPEKLSTQRKGTEEHTDKYSRSDY